METSGFQKIAGQDIRTPVFVIDETLLEGNLKVLDGVRKRTSCKIFLALKAFSMFSTFSLCKKYLDGVCASGLYEAKLGHDEFKKEVHTFSPAYSEEDIKELVKYSGTIIFNSFSQLKKFGAFVKKKGLDIGLRINPGFSDNPHPKYNPASPRAGFGVPIQKFKGENLSLLSMVDGLHFHVLCEQGSESLEKVLKHFEKDFGKYIPKMKWINFGGGHWITKNTPCFRYNIHLLINLINNFKKQYNVQVHLEPGEAVAIHTGVLISTILDVDSKGTKENEENVAVLDTSAATHMPDTLEMPYTPEVIGAEIVLPGKKPTKKYLYTLRGNTCMAGDIIGEGKYAFDKPLRTGDKIILDDMSHYTMVKTNTFNGVRLPSIALITKEGKYKVIKEFGYTDFKGRLS